jgi:rare lipoprotein A
LAKESSYLDLYPLQDSNNPDNYGYSGSGDVDIKTAWESLKNSIIAKLNSLNPAQQAVLVHEQEPKEVNKIEVLNEVLSQINTFKSSYDRQFVGLQTTILEKILESINSFIQNQEDNSILFEILNLINLFNDSFKIREFPVQAKIYSEEESLKQRVIEYFSNETFLVLKNRASNLVAEIKDPNSKINVNVLRFIDDLYHLNSFNKNRKEIRTSYNEHGIVAVLKFAENYSNIQIFALGYAKDFVKIKNRLIKISSQSSKNLYQYTDCFKESPKKNTALSLFKIIYEETKLNPVIKISSIDKSLQEYFENQDPNKTIYYKGNHNNSIDLSFSFSRRYKPSFDKDSGNITGLFLDEREKEKQQQEKGIQEKEKQEKEKQEKEKQEKEKENVLPPSGKIDPDLATKNKTKGIEEEIKDPQKTPKDKKQAKSAESPDKNLNPKNLNPILESTRTGPIKAENTENYHFSPIQKLPKLSTLPTLSTSGSPSVVPAAGSISQSSSISNRSTSNTLPANSSDDNYPQYGSLQDLIDDIPSSETPPSGPTTPSTDSVEASDRSTTGSQTSSSEKDKKRAPDTPGKKNKKGNRNRRNKGNRRNKTATTQTLSGLGLNIQQIAAIATVVSNFNLNLNVSSLNVEITESATVEQESFNQAVFKEESSEIPEPENTTPDKVIPYLPPEVVLEKDGNTEDGNTGFKLPTGILPSISGSELRTQVGSSPAQNTYQNPTNPISSPTVSNGQVEQGRGNITGQNQPGTGEGVVFGLNPKTGEPGSQVDLDRGSIDTGQNQPGTGEGVVFGLNPKTGEPGSQVDLDRGSIDTGQNQPGGKKFAVFTSDESKGEKGYTEEEKQKIRKENQNSLIVFTHKDKDGNITTDSGDLSSQQLSAIRDELQVPSRGLELAANDYNENPGVKETLQKGRDIVKQSIEALDKEIQAKQNLENSNQQGNPNSSVSASLNPADNQEETPAPFVPPTAKEPLNPANFPSGSRIPTNNLANNTSQEPVSEKTGIPQYQEEKQRRQTGPSDQSKKSDTEQNSEAKEDNKSKYSKYLNRVKEKLKLAKAVAAARDKLIKTIVSNAFKVVAGILIPILGFLTLVLGIIFVVYCVPIPIVRDYVFEPIAHLAGGTNPAAVIGSKGVQVVTYFGSFGFANLDLVGPSPFAKMLQNVGCGEKANAGVNCPPGYLPYRRVPDGNGGFRYIRVSSSGGGGSGGDSSIVVLGNDYSEMAKGRDVIDKWVGEASVYGTIGDASSGLGPGQKGRTASGELFNRNDFTAAVPYRSSSDKRPIVPFGTIARVTNLKTNKVIYVKVNNTGPFYQKYNRIIDLSPAAALALGFPKGDDGEPTGVVNVKVEYFNVKNTKGMYPGYRSDNHNQNTQTAINKKQNNFFSNFISGVRAQALSKISPDGRELVVDGIPAGVAYRSRGNVDNVRMDSSGGGVDFAISLTGRTGKEATLNTPVIAPLEGIVTKVEDGVGGWRKGTPGTSGSFGNQVFVYYPSINKTVHYSHLERNIPVSVGAVLSPGSLIARQGWSGSTLGNQEGRFVHISMNIYYGRVSAFSASALSSNSADYTAFMRTMMSYYAANLDKIRAQDFSPTSPGSSGGSISSEANQDIWCCPVSYNRNIASITNSQGSEDTEVDESSGKDGGDKEKAVRLFHPSILIKPARIEAQSTALDKPKEQSEETKISSSPSTTSLSTEAADPCGCIRPLSAGGSSTVEGDGSVDSGSGAGGVACLAAPRKGVLANPYLRAFMRALGEAESNGSYTKTNSGRCYGRYQFCPFGTWPDIAGEPDGLGGTFPTDITKATPAQQDSAFVAAWNKEAKNRKGKNENIFDISNLISTLQNEGIDAVFDKANRGASATAGITRYGMCGAWTPLCHSSIDPRQGKQSLIRRVYQQVLTEEKAGTCGGGRTSTTQNNKVDVQAVFSSLNIENLLTVTTVASEENKDTTKPKKSSTSGRPFDCPHPEDDGGSSGNPNFDGSFIKPTTGHYSCGFGTDPRIT